MNHHLHHHHQQPQQQQQQQQQQYVQSQQQNGSGLTRYRSAPSSYFDTLLNRSNSSSHGGFETEDFEQNFNLRASSPETQRIFSRFMNSSDNLPEAQLNSSSQIQGQKCTNYPSVSQMMYQNHTSEAANSVTDDSYNESLGPISSNPISRIKMESGSSNIIRHSSSPAGLFASINIENEFVKARAMGNLGPNPFSSGLMSPISEISSKGLGDNTTAGDAYLEDDRAENYNDYFRGHFAANSWDVMPDNFLNENKNENSSDDQNTHTGNRPTALLSHHLSLPKSCSELSAMEKLLQDSVPCRIRAKRGCATHPRSIAERVRRTKISERMRKLQELVPNMEKQTNTSDMLDLAVDYIKDLQTQVKMLSDNRGKCMCSAMQNP